MGQCKIIAEVAQAHDGSLGMAHAFIDAIAKTNADGVKFQIHIADAESTPQEKWRIKFSYQDSSRYDYWKRMEFTTEQWMGLKKHADDCNLKFIGSPFSTEAVDLLKKIGVWSWKVASGEINNFFIFNKIAETKLPLIISTGMSTIDEIDNVVKKVRAADLNFTLLQCTSIYPCPAEKVGLNLINLFRDRYNCPVGLSDHSGMIYTGLAAATLGIDILEIHITLSKEMFGPDVVSSITASELKNLVEGVKFIENMIKNPVDKNKIAKELKNMRDLFTKSIIANKSIMKGTIIRADDIVFKKPGTGISVEKVDEVIGKKVNRNINYNEIINWDDLEDA